MQWMPRSEILTFEEIERLARICVEQYGFDGIRLTGGEPTIRAHITRLVSKLAALGVDLAMTTNGATLRNLASGLREAGLNRINISLDTLDRDKFFRMTRRDELANVLDGIAAAKQAGFERIKINAVVERGTNDDEIVDLARFGRDEGIEVRFIEFMPLDASDAWQRAQVVGQDEIVAAIAAEWQIEVLPARGAAPANVWRYLDGNGTVGVIPTVTKPFCGDCDRVRLTADGQFRTCLFASDEFDLRDAMRNGETDDQIARRIEAAVGTKWAGHQINQVNFIRPTRTMSQIGG